MIALCPNCESDKHARCCSRCGQIHKPKRLHFEHCSAKCAREAAEADRLSAAMQEDLDAAAEADRLSDAMQEDLDAREDPS